MGVKGRILFTLIYVLLIVSSCSGNFQMGASEDLASEREIVSVEFVEVTRSPPLGELIFPGDEFTLTYVVENNGEVPAPDFEFKIPDVPGGITIIEEPPPQTIPPGQKASFTFRLRAIAEGEYELTAQAFLSGQLHGKVSFTVSISEPIVVILPVEVKTTPRPGERVVPGNNVSFTMTLKNYGIAPARSVGFKPETVPEGIELVEESPPCEIKPGETRDFTLRFLCKKAGLYEIPLTIVVAGETTEYVTLTISVSKPQLFTWPILAALAAAAVALTLIVYRRRRKRPVAAPPPSPEARPVEAPSLFCIHCGAPIKASARFCTKCGKPQQE